MSRFLAGSALAIILWQLATEDPSPRLGTPSADPIRLHYPDGSVRDEFSLDSSGRVHGVRRQWYPDGMIQRETVFAHGSWESIRAWWPNGALQEESTTHLLTSTRKYWDEEGRPID
jgi:antitoxin component YwqK of YwqJK toxin-antitoxin module